MPTHRIWGFCTYKTVAMEMNAAQRSSPHLQERILARMRFCRFEDQVSDDLSRRHPNLVLDVNVTTGVSKRVPWMKIEVRRFRACCACVAVLALCFAGRDLGPPLWESQVG